MTTNKKKTGRDHSFLFETSTRYCTNHMGTANAGGGKWLVTSNGKLRRLICAGCAERRMERLERLNTAGDQPAKEKPAFDRLAGHAG